MFQRILVLLDGSKRAELALPVAARLARASGASLTLLRMVTLPPDYVWYKLEPPFLAQDILATEMLNASTYLKVKVWEMEAAGIPVRTHVMPDLPLEQVHTFIEGQAIDLVVLCSRGQISFRPRTQRSMTQQVLRQSPVPVLVLQETCGQSGTLYPRDARPVRILVPLDGSALAETALPPAAELSAALSAPLSGMLHLVRVLPSANVLGATEVIGQLRGRVRDDALAYLQATSQAPLCSAIGQLPLSVTTSVLLQPDVAEAIVRVAEAKPQNAETGGGCDIIALTPHGRSGHRHPSMGNTAERILQETRLPFLVVPPPLDERKGGKAGSAPLAFPQGKSVRDGCFQTR